MSARRRTGPPQLVVIAWRDIPAQVTVTGGPGSPKAMLPPRFQRAIDRAARVAGMTEHRAYISAWHRTSLPVHGDPAEAVAATVARLDAEHDRATLESLIRQGGWSRPADASSNQPLTPTLRSVDDPGGGP